MDCKIIVKIRGRLVISVHLLIKKFNYSFLIYDVNEFRRLAINKIKKTEKFLIRLSRSKEQKSGFGLDFEVWPSWTNEEEEKWWSKQFDIELSDYFFSAVCVDYNTRREIKNLLKRGKLRKPKNKTFIDRNSFSREQIKNISRFYHGKRK